MSKTKSPSGQAKIRRGGIRPGAGQYPKMDDLHRINITVQGSDIEHARILGEGNVSLGIRIAIRRSK